MPNAEHFWIEIGRIGCAIKQAPTILFFSFWNIFSKILLISNALSFLSHIILASAGVKSQQNFKHLAASTEV